jgi:hypothetical protein
MRFPHNYARENGRAGFEPATWFDRVNAHAVQELSPEEQAFLDDLDDE